MLSISLVQFTRLFNFNMEPVSFNFSNVVILLHLGFEKINGEGLADINIDKSAVVALVDRPVRFLAETTHDRQGSWL